MFEIKKINDQNIEAVFKLYQKIYSYNKNNIIIDIGPNPFNVSGK